MLAIEIRRSIYIGAQREAWTLAMLTHNSLVYIIVGSGEQRLQLPKWF